MAALSTGWTYTQTLPDNKSLNTKRRHTITTCHSFASKEHLAFIHLRICGSVKHRRLLELHFVLQYKKKRHGNGLQTMAPLTSELTAYIHDHNPQHCNVLQQRNVFSSILPPHFNPTDETGDSNSVISQNPTCAWRLNYLQTIITNYLRGIGGSFPFCVAHRIHWHEWWITDFSSTPALFFVLVSIFQNSPCISSPVCIQRPSAGQNGTHKDKQLTTYVSEEEKKSYSQKFPFHNMDPHHFGFNLKSTAQWYSFIFSRHSLFIVILILVHAFLSVLNVPLSTYLPISAFISCPSLLQSSLHLVSHTLWRGKNHKGHAFSLTSLRVHTKGEKKRRAVGRRKGQERGNVTREKGGKCKRGSNKGPSTVPVNWWRGCPGAPRVCLQPERTASNQKWKSIFSQTYIFQSLTLTNTHAK